MICAKCKEDKPNQDFNKSKRNRSGYHSYCRDCHKGHYKQNAEKYIKNAGERNKKYRERVFGYLKEYLDKNPCVMCGEDDIIVLEFDHLRDKIMPVGSLIRAGYALSKIKEEINKCQVLCANCHRRKTTKENNWWRGNI